MFFKIISEISEIENIATAHSIIEINRLNKAYSKARWRKMKGIAAIQLENDRIVTAEIHWYEAHGIGRKEYKIKRLLSP